MRAALEEARVTGRDVTTTWGEAAVGVGLEVVAAGAGLHHAVGPAGVAVEVGLEGRLEARVVLRG